MPTFDTPDPITAIVDVGVGDARVTAGDRRDTTVVVEPRDPSNAQDREVAEQTRVDYAGGRLVVRAPKLKSWRVRGSGGAIVVTVELPAGSQLHGAGGILELHSDGPLGDCRIKAGAGRIALDEVGDLTVKSGASDISVERVRGATEIRVATGDVRLGELGGAAMIKKSNDDTWIGRVEGDLRVTTANGDISVDVANASVSAKTARGDLRVGDAARGSIALETHLGDVEVGIREGSAAWLDVRSTAGVVRNDLAAAGRPDPAAETLEVRARTHLGNIVIARPAAAVSA
jgi:Putative adhesin